MGGWAGTWVLERLIWGVPVALGLGHALGHALGRLAIWLRAREPESNAPNDLLMLALICLSYVLAEQAGAWGFLAVFAAGVGLRRAEIQVVRGNPHPDHLRTGNEDDIPASHPPAEHMVAASVEPRALNEPAVAAGVLVAESLSFGETLERLIEFVLVLLIGVALSSHYEPRALLLGAALLLVVRPLATALLLIGTKTSSAQRCLMAWFGVRGVGSLYYVSYALSHGLEGEAARVAVDTTLTVTAISIILHGVTAAPLISRYQRGLERQAAREHARPPA